MKPTNLYTRQPLEEYDSRVTVVPLSGYTWSTYPEIEALGLLKDVITREWADESMYHHAPN